MQVAFLQPFGGYDIMIACCGIQVVGMFVFSAAWDTWPHSRQFDAVSQESGVHKWVCYLQFIITRLVRSGARATR
jgi:hypothetical protein